MRRDPSSQNELVTHAAAGLFQAPALPWSGTIPLGVLVLRDLLDPFLHLLALSPGAVFLGLGEVQESALRLSGALALVPGRHGAPFFRPVFVTHIPENQQPTCHRTPDGGSPRPTLGPEQDECPPSPRWPGHRLLVRATALTAGKDSRPPRQASGHLSLLPMFVSHPVTDLVPRIATLGPLTPLWVTATVRPNRPMRLCLALFLAKWAGGQ